MGETPTRFSDKADRSVSLLFGDAGSATALEAVQPGSTVDWHYALHSDGSGYNNMIIESGGFRDRFVSDSRKHCVRMNGALIFNFTIKRVPALIDETWRVPAFLPTTSTILFPSIEPIHYEASLRKAIAPS